MGVACAAADVPNESHPDLLFGWIRIPLEKVTKVHQDSRRAVSTLESMSFLKRFLEEMRIVSLRKALDCRHTATIDLDCKKHARLHSFALEVNRTGPTYSLKSTADVSASKLQVLPQKVDKQHPYGYLCLYLLAINSSAHCFHTRFHSVTRSALWIADTTTAAPSSRIKIFRYSADAHVSL